MLVIKIMDSEATIKEETVAASIQACFPQLRIGLIM